MGEDEDDFLEETIEFGDGTQYKIDADASPPPPPPPVNRWAVPGAGLTGAKSSVVAEEFHDGVSRAEPFKDDFDRSWARPAAGSGDARTLFNDRLGKLEPYATKASPGAIAGRGGPPPIDMPHANSLRKHVEIDAPPHQERGDGRRRESISSQRSDKGRRDEPRSWTRDGPRRPSIEHASQGGRQLPPHLSAANPPRSTTEREPPPHRVPTLSSSPPSRHAQPPSINAVLSPTKSTAPLPPVAPVSVVEATTPAPASAPPAVVDLEELHAREMHAAAERARKRRAEEEESRLAQVERMKKKAEELAEKMAKPVVAEPARREPLPIPTAAESWRDRRASTVVAAQVPAPVVKSEPIKILAREVPLASAAPAPPSALPTTRSVPPHLAARPPPSVVATPVVAPRVTEDREWRREPVPAEPRARQPPPHLAAPASATSPTSPIASVSPAPAVVEEPAAILRVEPSSASRATASPAVKVALRPREISGLDDLMSRIKGAMSLPKEIVADAAQTVLTPGSHSPAAPPTVRLPPLAVPAAPERAAPTVVLPPAAKGRGAKSQPRLPTFENREPVVLFDVTTIERSQSPPPAWKAFVVRLASYPRLSTPSQHQVQSFSNPLLPTRVAIQSPLRRLLRDDPLHPKRLANKGQLVVPVTVTSRRLVRRTEVEEAVVAAVLLASYRPAVPLTNGTAGGKGKGRAPERGTWRRGDVVGDVMASVLEEVTTTSKASTADLFLESQPLSRIPSTSAFTGPSTPIDPTLSSAPVDFSREYMVTRELNGEEVLKLVSRGTAPGDGALDSSHAVVRHLLDLREAD